MKYYDKNLQSIKKRSKMLIKEGKLDKARELYFSHCKDYPTDKDSWLTLSALSRRLGAYQDAEYCANIAISLGPDNVTALAEYGAALQCQGRINNAIAVYNKALSVNPNSGLVHYYLANAFLECGKIDDAITHYQKTIECIPDHIEALNNLSAIFTDQGNVEASIRLLNHALKLKPNGYHMLINLARSHLYSGNAGKAFEILSSVISKYPHSPEAHSKYLLCLNYLPNINPEYMYNEHIRWAEQHASNITQFTYYDNTLTSDRIIHIGYLSPDLKSHSVAYFFESILANHDKNKFTITCYSDAHISDEISDRLASYSDNWHLTAYKTTEELSTQIRQEKVDILVDLAGHTANNRLAVFAMKPAPVQISYLGYPNTTGLTTVDYRLTDNIADPPGVSDQYYTECLVRLPHSFICYLPPDENPDIANWPRHHANKIVYCSFNNLAKVTPEVINVWSQILTAQKTSKLLLKSKSTSDPYTKSRLLELFHQSGINENRLIFVGYSKSRTEHLDIYNTVDIALDTFPYNGTTTTCEALWMGIPVITLSGITHAGRVGSSILDTLGLDNLIAHDTEQYCNIATRLANDISAQELFGESLRQRMRSSYLCNSHSFTRSLETEYSRMWAKYCVNHPEKR